MNEKNRQSVNDWRSGEIDELHSQIFQYRIRLDSLEAKLRYVNEAYANLLSEKIYFRRVLRKIAGPDDFEDPGMTNWAVLGKWARELARDALSGKEIL